MVEKSGNLSPIASEPCIFPLMPPLAPKLVLYSTLISSSLCVATHSGDFRPRGRMTYLAVLNGMSIEWLPKRGLCYRSHRAVMVFRA